jgi:chromosome segregation ATPase
MRIARSLLKRFFLVGVTSVLPTPARLVHAKEQVRAKRKLEAMLRQTRQHLHDAEETCDSHRHRLEAEKADVSKLEGLGLTALFYTILGTKKEHLKKEKEEYLAAKLKYEAAAKAVAEAREEVQRLQKELGEFRLSDAEYEEILDEKRRFLTEAGGDRATQLLDLSERLADLSADHKELREALDAGGRALAALEQVQSELQSAANWGTWDLLGGGLLVTMRSTPESMRLGNTPTRPSGICGASRKSWLMRTSV